MKLGHQGIRKGPSYTFLRLIVINLIDFILQGMDLGSILTNESFLTYEAASVMSYKS